MQPAVLDIPFRIVKLKWALSSIESGRREVSDSDTFEGGVLSIGGEHIGWHGEWFLDHPRYISKKFYDSLNSGKIKTHDILLVKDGATIGKTAIADESLPESAVNEHVFLIRFKEHSSKFFFYVFQSSFFKKQIQIEIRGAAQPGLNSEFINKTFIPLPPYDKQQKIANFLDKETKRIDALIAEKEKMVALLDEKRSALISRVVTRGIDSNVELKPSGVEWLGKIPKHWNIKKFQYVFNLYRGLTITKKDLQDEGIPCINYGEIHSKYGFEVKPERDKLKCVDIKYLETYSNSVLKKGDIVFADTSEDIDGSGNFTLYNSELTAFAGYHTIIAKCCIGFTNHKYIAYLFESNGFRNQIRERVKGVKVFSITNEILKETLIILPPFEEQNIIVKYLDDKIESLKNHSQLVQKSIDLLKERRSALITEAVTGRLEIA